MSRKQVERAYRKLWDRMTLDDGYQPFGYDEPTLRITHPGFFPARDRLRQMWNQAKE
jgi:hypothetical protein